MSHSFQNKCHNKRRKGEEKVSLSHNGLLLNSCSILKAVYTYQSAELLIVWLSLGQEHQFTTLDDIPHQLNNIVFSNQDNIEGSTTNNSMMEIA